MLNIWKKNGFDVEVINDTDAYMQVKEDNKIPERLYGCHTTLVENYVFEGHVPAEIVNKVLENKPFMKGVSVPGMPAGTPGMGGEKQGPIEVYTMTFQPTDSPEVYATF